MHDLTTLSVLTTTWLHTPVPHRNTDIPPTPGNRRTRTRAPGHRPAERDLVVHPVDGCAETRTSQFGEEGLVRMRNHDPASDPTPVCGTCWIIAPGSHLHDDGGSREPNGRREWCTQTVHRPDTREKGRHHRENPCGLGKREQNRSARRKGIWDALMRS